jgi:hypothetical protein
MGKWKFEQQRAKDMEYSTSVEKDASDGRYYSWAKTQEALPEMPGGRRAQPWISAVFGTGPLRG